MGNIEFADDWILVLEATTLPTEQQPLSQIYVCVCWVLEGFFFILNGPIPASFVYFRSFLVTISIQIEKSIDGVLGIRTQGRRMVGADKTTELWQPPKRAFIKGTKLLSCNQSNAFIFRLFPQ